MAAMVDASSRRLRTMMPSAPASAEEFFVRCRFQRQALMSGGLQAFGQHRMHVVDEGDAHGLHQGMP